MAWSAGIHNGSFAQQSERAWNIIDNMPSLRSISGYALSAAALAQSVLAGNSISSNKARQLENAASASCSNPQLSCHNTTVQTNLCCFNAPGGSLLQTQFWDTNPPTGPSDSWTIHGLWVSSYRERQAFTTKLMIY